MQIFTTVEAVVNTDNLNLNEYLRSRFSHYNLQVVQNTAYTRNIYFLEAKTENNYGLILVKLDQSLEYLIDDVTSDLPAVNYLKFVYTIAGNIKICRVYQSTKTKYKIYLIKQYFKTQLQHLTSSIFKLFKLFKS